MKMGENEMSALIHVERKVVMTQRYKPGLILTLKMLFSRKMTFYIKKLLAI